MAEYSNAGLQTVNPGESVTFTETPVPCNRGFVRHRADSGNFLLSGWIPHEQCGCRNSATYLVEFGANIAIPTDPAGTVEPISLSIAIDGATIPASTMVVTPTATGAFFNVSRAINVQIWRGCCESVTIRNTSAQPVLVENANVLFSRPDLTITR